MSELEEFKKAVSPIAYGLAYKSKLGTTEYQQLYAEEDVIKYFSNKPSLTIPKSIAKELDNINASEYESLVDRFIEDYEDDSLSEKLTEFSSKSPYNYHLCILYLVGEELGKRTIEVENAT